MEPLAYIVYCPIGHEFDYKIFTYLSEAIEEVQNQEADGFPVPDLLPLFTGDPIKL